MPPLREHRLGRLIASAAERLGYHPFIGPTAINSVDYDSRPATNYCGFCLGYGCRIKAKGSPNVNVLPRALWTGNLEIIPEANVVGLDVDENSPGGGPARLRAVRYVSEGETREVRAKLFMLASYTFENTRLLLHSRSSRFPNGLCNNSGQVGKHFMIHTFDSVAMWFDDQFTNRFGNHGQRICIDDLNADNFDHAGLGFIGGAQIFAPNEGHLIQDLGFTPPGVKFWGREYKDYVKEYWNRQGFLMTVLEVLPYESNFLELDPERTDEHGVPMIIANFSMQENEERLRAFMFEKMMEIAREAGANGRRIPACFCRPRTTPAARAWAPRRRIRWSTAGAARTRPATCSFSVLPCSRPAAVTIRRSRLRRSPGGARSMHSLCSENREDRRGRVIDPVSTGRFIWRGE